MRCSAGGEAPRQTYGELGESADLAGDLDRAAMLMGDDVVANRKSKPGAFPGRLGGEERLEELVLDLGGNADAVVAHPNLDGLAEIPRGNRQQGVERPVAFLALALVRGIATVAEQVEEHS